MKKIVAFTLPVAMTLGLTACDPQPKNPEPVVKPEISSAADLGRRIERLASDEYAGRAPGTPGGKAASHYIADEMKAVGLQAMGENGTYFQGVELNSTTVMPSSAMSISKGDMDVMVSDMHDTKENSVYWSKRLDPSISIEDSELVFVGYGVVAPEYGWNDYEGIDVKGK